MRAPGAFAITFAATALATLGASVHKNPEPAASPLSPVGSASAQAPAPSQPARNPERNAYFGETHLHTSWSPDAYIFGNHLTGPAEAYDYAKGKPIKHPLGYTIKIETPLDWMGVTDHSEYVGVVRLANDPTSAISKLPIADSLRVKTPSDVQRIFSLIVSALATNHPDPALVTPEITHTVWAENVKIADAANQPGKFTAFCSYEWTSAPQFRNMHRNVFFRACEHVPERPFSAFDSQDPSDLWAWMDTQRKAGNELLAISHNANLSDGHMYPIDVDEKGRPIDAAWAASRDRNERLVEIKQIKGQSEAHPLLSPNDEFANYEVVNWEINDPRAVPAIPGSYARQALKDGLSMQDVWGFNPYKLGFGGGSDSHNSASAYRQNNFFGGHGEVDGLPQVRLAGFYFAGMDLRFMGPGSLTGVWAEENTRASIFDAMMRKETFGTSGPHIRVRMFGGWAYTKRDMDERSWAEIGYQKGVPMGSDLPAMAGKAPTFMVWAYKDPSSANLDRLQIVKGWSKSGQSFERVYDVAWAGDRKVDAYTGQVPPIANTVNVTTATYDTHEGRVELKAVWTDPDFDPSLHAFYYSRVLEVPTPRWTTIQAKELGVPAPSVVSPSVQERAYGSPIWYTPSEDARKAAKPAGMTVGDLKTKGFVQLTDAELQQMLVGKAFFVMNRVTGGIVQVTAAESGVMYIWFADPRVPQPSDFGELAMKKNGGVGTPYVIKNNQVTTMVGNAPFSYTFYKMGEQVVIARSNEFGYANYEMVPPPKFLDPAVFEKWMKEHPQAAKPSAGGGSR